MRVAKLIARRYRSLENVELPLEQVNLLIGTNASGKSNVLDALRFMSEGARRKDFVDAVSTRGGIIHLAWKGEAALHVDLTAIVQDGEKRFEWEVTLLRGGQQGGYGFSVREGLRELGDGKPPRELLKSVDGKGWWWSADKQVSLDIRPTDCALAAAAVDGSFAGRSLAAFAASWGFFDPVSIFLRRAADAREAPRLDPLGNNLAMRLKALETDRADVFKRILGATRAALGVPDEIMFHVSDDGRVYFVQRESGLSYPVHQVGASSGTLRVLALITALLGEDTATLIGIEEPENHIHPAALRAFAECLRQATAQLIVTTHSPLLLTALNMPEAVCVVRRTEHGTTVEREQHPDAVRKALAESGFSLGEFYETSGFGA